MIYARFIYAGLLIIALAWVLVADFLLDKLYPYICWEILSWLPWCLYSTKNSIGYFHLLKVSMIFFVFHLLLLLLTLPADFAKGVTLFKNIHRRLWWVKLPVLAVLYALTLLIPNPVYVAYMIVALVLSVPFIAAQVVLLTEFAVRTNNAVVRRIPQGSGLLLLALSVGLLAIAGLQYVITGTLYFFCFPVWPLYLVGFILVTVIVIFSIAIERGSLFVAAVLSLFFTFMVVLAIESNSEFWSSWINDVFSFFGFVLPRMSYCPLEPHFSSYWADFFLGSVFSLVFKLVHSIWGGVFLITAVLMSCFSSFGLAPTFAGVDNPPPVSGFDSGNDDDKESGADITYHYWQFHALMTLASAAIPVAFGTLSSGLFSWYLPVSIIAAVLIGAGLYLWGLAAPSILRNRRFYGGVRL
ncbi:Serine incorporator/TMS membrane protein [Carpediemonas membranifera]|uniref:Serine incorporator/TMS membrane protein n=1 Tax=Carpediemonas membranifera TaxID=201153 RepID=A0A8J6C0Z0_9EUKA|nr:Serine incorporator/TMS membrane protein [Carpediemonas membranifera]|eukprot:KAG9397056.1 Serine incorporator/TMS membrane protein [Carpediemonas membranifera]